MALTTKTKLMATLIGRRRDLMVVCDECGCPVYGGCDERCGQEVAS
jgi:hypothetical protein